MTFLFLASLNLADALLSWWLFVGLNWGPAYEANFLMRILLEYDTTGTLFLLIKFSLSLLLVICWKKAKRIHRILHIMSSVGIIVYLLMFSFVAWQWWEFF